jgi:hypothetical protein
MTTPSSSPSAPSPASPPAAVPEVVRARRVEIVDDEGNVRVVLGQLDGPEVGQPTLGLSVLDADGQPRISALLTSEGPTLLLEMDGNGVLQLGVDDPTPEAMRTGSFIQLSAPDGRPALGWQVEEDGSVTMRTGPP